MKKEQGITLVSLSVTIIVLIIIAGISVYSGKDVIKNGKLEELRTNMLLVQVKARETVEQANFKMGPNPDETKKTEVRKEVYETGAKLEKISDSGITAPSGANSENCYVVTEEALKNWGLNKIELSEGEYYIIEFDDTNAKVEIYNTLGYSNNGTMVYSLTQIDNI